MAAEPTRIRRVAPHAAVLETDIYVASGSTFRAQVQRAESLLRDKKTVKIHGLGRMLPRAIDLALAVQHRMGSKVQCRVTTETVEVVDDLEPEDPEEDVATQTRSKSAVHITIFPVA